MGIEFFNDKGTLPLRIALGELYKAKIETVAISGSPVGENDTLTNLFVRDALSIPEGLEILMEKINRVIDMRHMKTALSEIKSNPSLSAAEEPADSTSTMSLNK